MQKQVQTPGRMPRLLLFFGGGVHGGVDDAAKFGVFFADAFEFFAHVLDSDEYALNSGKTFFANGVKLNSLLVAIHHKNPLPNV